MTHKHRFVPAIMDSLMLKTLLILSLVIFLGACASSPDTGLNLPYSERTDIIHAYEAINFIPVDKGEKDIILFFKSSPVETLKQYQTFDTNVVSQSSIIYKSINNRIAASHMRKYIRKKLKQYRFKHTGKSLSKAGIATTISSYQKILGKNVEELMMVVFDRAKARQLSIETPDLKGFHLLKKTAVWVGVVRKVPEKQVDVSKSVHRMTDESFRQMVDLMFEVFMKDSGYIPLD